MNISFTGTQRGMTVYQSQELRALILKLTNGSPPHWFHHGDCIGADAEAHVIANQLGMLIHKYPSDIPNKCANSEDYDLKKPPYPPLVRNKMIVDAGEVLIACPAEENEVLRSGTWSTVRYARKKGKKIFIIAPKESRLQCLARITSIVT